MTRPLAYPRTVLVDSGATLALADADDGNHTQAVQIRPRLIAARSRLYLTNYLVDESYTLLMSRVGYRFAIRFLDELPTSDFTMVRITPEDEERAERLLRRYHDKRFSYTDATSFVIVERLGIEAAFTFDENFSQYGVHVLTP